VESREPPVNGTFGVGEVDPLARYLRPAFKGPLILNSDFDAARAQVELDAGIGDAVALADRLLQIRIFQDASLKVCRWQRMTPQKWFTQGAEGYLDYTTWSR
jgi:hypothetical protein